VISQAILLNKIALQSNTDHSEEDIQTGFFAPVTLTLTRWPCCMN